MEPKREPGDDRVMWKIRPLRALRLDEASYMKPAGPWAIVEHSDDACDMIDGGDLGSSYEIMQMVITAEQWNEMPEFEGW